MKKSNIIKLLVIFCLLFFAVKMPFELIQAMIWTVKPAYIAIEFMLDEMIAVSFGTDPRTTEIIVFYVMSFIGVFAAYASIVYIRFFLADVKADFEQWRTCQTAIIRQSWQTAGWAKKSKVLFGFAVTSSFAALLALN